MKILMKRLERKLEEEVSVTQAGFKTNRGIRNHIFNFKNDNREVQRIQSRYIFLFY